MYDFKDGNGPVPAKKHVNGGGWVADSASVEEDAFIAENAVVFGNATLGAGNIVIMDHVRIHGDAFLNGPVTVRDTVDISGNTYIDYKLEIFGDCVLTSNPKCIIGFEHPIIVTDNRVLVGCHSHDFEYWKAHGAAIIKVNGYPTKSANRLQSFIMDCVDLHKSVYDIEELDNYE